MIWFLVFHFNNLFLTSGISALCIMLLNTLQLVQHCWYKKFLQISVDFLCPQCLYLFKTFLLCLRQHLQDEENQQCIDNRKYEECSWRTTFKGKVKQAYLLCFSVNRMARKAFLLTHDSTKNIIPKETIENLLGCAKIC